MYFLYWGYKKCYVKKEIQEYAIFGGGGEYVFIVGQDILF